MKIKLLMCYLHIIIEWINNYKILLRTSLEKRRIRRIIRRNISHGYWGFKEAQSTFRLNEIVWVNFWEILRSDVLLYKQPETGTER